MQKNKMLIFLPHLYTKNNINDIKINKDVKYRCMHLMKTPPSPSAISCRGDDGLWQTGPVVLFI